MKALFDDRPVSYVALGGAEELSLTPGIVRTCFARPTKRGFMPTNTDLILFMMLCKARKLDPWVGDAFLVGYDQDDGPQFSLITAYQALLKRAELNTEYRGLQGGVIVKKAGDKDAEPVEREGSMVYDGEALLGAWARTTREGHSVATYAAIKLSAYDKKRSLWKSNPSGMIVKCAKAAVLREAFPSQCGGLYISDEMGADSDSVPDMKAALDQAERDKADEDERQRPKDVPQEQLDQLKKEIAQRQQQASQEPLPEDLSKPPVNDPSIVPADVQAGEPEDRPSEPPEDYDGPTDAEIEADKAKTGPYSTDEDFHLQ